MSIDFPKEEESILKRWKEINAFQRQLQLSEGRKHYTFYDGCAVQSCKSRMILTVDQAAFRNRITPLWPSAGIYDQRHHSSILVYERLPCGETLRLGYTWAPHRARN